MANYIVTRKSDGVEMLRYSSEVAQEVNGYNLVDYDHTEWFPDDQQVPTATNWRIDIGSFLDRFGAQRLAILANPDAMIQAFFKDILARKYIDLKSRRAELAQGIAYLNANGFALDEVAILDLVPSADEVWNA